MGKTMKRRIFSGAVCEQIVYSVGNGVKNLSAYDPEKVRKERFEDAEAYRKHKENIARRNHYKKFQANFSPSSLYSTLTFSDDYEVHTFPEAKLIRKKFVRELKKVYPDAVIFLYMGRGKGTSRIHFHMVSQGVPKEYIADKWHYGSVVLIVNLREHNYYKGIDHGQDYAGLANYLFDHWTEEVGGHRWMQTRNARKPDREEPEEVKIRGGYSEKRPPIAPKGFMLVDVERTTYGYTCFKYVVIPPKHIRGKAAENTGFATG